MSEESGGAVPLWRQVLDDLERRISTGEFAERFPTDRELTDRYGVSRHTVREAVRRLRARGLVERQRGRGSFLTPRLTQPLGGVPSLFRAVEEQGIAQRSQVLALGLVRNAEAAAWLGIDEQADLVRIERLRFAADEPLALDTVWLPADVAAPLLDVDFTRTALYDELSDRVGVRITDVEEEIEPVVADASARQRLALDDDEALLSIRRSGWAGGRLIEARLTLIRGQRFVYTNAWSEDDSGGPITTFRASAVGGGV